MAVHQDPQAIWQELGRTQETQIEIRQTLRNLDEQEQDTERFHQRMKLFLEELSLSWAGPNRGCTAAVSRELAYFDEELRTVARKTYVAIDSEKEKLTVELKKQTNKENELQYAYDRLNAKTQP